MCVWGGGGVETYVSLNIKIQRPEYRPFEVDDEVVGVPPHCHGFLSTLVSAATRTIPGVVLVQHLTENKLQQECGCHSNKDNNYSKRQTQTAPTSSTATASTRHPDYIIRRLNGCLHGREGGWVGCSSGGWV